MVSGLIQALCSGGEATGILFPTSAFITTLEIEANP